MTADRAPQRIQLRRTKGWRKPEGAIVVARPTKWGNPYRIDEYRCDYPDSSDAELRAMATSDFRGLIEGRWAPAASLGWSRWRWERGTYPVADIAQLRGHDLACWCPLDQACHADVLLEIANG